MPSLKPSGAAGPTAPVVTDVTPGCVTLEKVTVTGIPPVAGSIGRTITLAPAAVLATTTLSCTAMFSGIVNMAEGSNAGASCTAMFSGIVNMADGSNAGASCTVMLSGTVNIADGSNAGASCTAMFSGTV